MDNDRWKLRTEIGGILGAALLIFVGLSSGNMWIWAMGVICAFATVAIVMLFFE
jgi:ABC-type Fe3+-siderophore transport system permease subunit